MKRTRDRQLTTSRALLVIVGSILLAGAALAALLATKAIDRIGESLDARTALLNARGQRLLNNNQLAFQLGVLGCGLLLMAAGLVWLTNQIPPHRHQEDNTFDNPDPDIAGRNTVAGGALARALEHDLEHSPHVQRARAEFRSDDGLIRLRLDIDDDCSSDEIVTGVVEPAIERITTVSQLGTRPHLQIDLRPVAGSVRRVR